MSVTFYYNVQS